MNILAYLGFLVLTVIGMCYGSSKWRRTGSPIWVMFIILSMGMLLISGYLLNQYVTLTYF